MNIKSSPRDDKRRDKAKRELPPSELQGKRGQTSTSKDIFEDPTRAAKKQRRDEEIEGWQVRPQENFCAQNAHPKSKNDALRRVEDHHLMPVGVNVKKRTSEHRRASTSRPTALISRVGSGTPTLISPFGPGGGIAGACLGRATPGVTTTATQDAPAAMRPRIRSREGGPERKRKKTTYGRRGKTKILMR